VVQVCVIGNLCPETVEEAKALVPSITVSLSNLPLKYGQLITSHYTLLLLSQSCRL
jgi:hypothetical protein